MRDDTARLLEVGEELQIGATLSVPKGGPSPWACALGDPWSRLATSAPQVHWRAADEPALPEDGPDAGSADGGFLRHDGSGLIEIQRCTIAHFMHIIGSSDYQAAATAAVQQASSPAQNTECMELDNRIAKL